MEGENSRSLRLHRVFLPAFVASAIAPFVIAILLQMGL